MKDEKLIELNELDAILNEIRRVLNFFKDETDTDLWIEEYSDDSAKLINELTGATYKIKVEKIN